YEQHQIAYREEVEAQGLEWEKEKSNDPWKGLFNYSNAEYRDGEGRLVPESEAQKRQVSIWVWQEGDASMPATKQAASTREPQHKNWRFYKPLHPCLSTWGLLLLKCQHVGAITGLPLGGNDHVTGHDFCPLCQGAPDLCDGSGGLGAAFGCAP